MSQYDWLKGSHMTRVVWVPNETDYIRRICGAKYSYLVVKFEAILVYLIYVEMS